MLSLLLPFVFETTVGRDSDIVIFLIQEAFLKALTFYFSLQKAELET